MTPLEKSITSNPMPTNIEEDRVIYSTGIDSTLSIEDLEKEIEKLKDEGFESIEFERVDQKQKCLVFSKAKRRSSEEIFQCRRDWVQYKFLRWFKDARRREQLLLKDRTTGAINYKKRIEVLKKRNFLVPEDMKRILSQKESKLEHHQKAIDFLSHFIDNYENYEYDYLRSLPDQVFPNGSGRITSLPELKKP